MRRNTAQPELTSLSLVSITVENHGPKQSMENSRNEQFAGLELCTVLGSVTKALVFFPVPLMLGTRGDRRGVLVPPVPVTGDVLRVCGTGPASVVSQSLCLGRKVTLSWCCVSVPMSLSSVQLISDLVSPRGISRRIMQAQ